MEKILNLLEEDLHNLAENVLPTKDWKFYKFGKGGPYKDLLPHLQKRSTKYDEKIQEHFLVDTKEYVSWTRLLQLCILHNPLPTEVYKYVSTMERQIKRMRQFIRRDMDVTK